MKRALILILLPLFALQACRKEDESKTTDNRKFFEKERKTIVKETFEFGSISSSLDADNYIILNKVVYTQVGVCASIENGYLNIGCVEPLTPPFQDTDEWRTYEAAYVDKAHNFKSSYPLVNEQLLSKNIGIQIDYIIGGNTEFYIGKFFISNTLQAEDLNGKSLHVNLDTESGNVAAYLDDINVSDLFVTEVISEATSEIIFRANSSIEEKGGVNYINLNGLRIDLIEIYNL